MSTLSHSVSPGNSWDHYEPSAADLAEYQEWASAYEAERWDARINADCYPDECPELDAPDDDDVLWWAEECRRAESRRDHDAALARLNATIADARAFMDAFDARCREPEEFEAAEMGSTPGHPAHEV